MLFQLLVLIFAEKRLGLLLLQHDLMPGQANQLFMIRKTNLTVQFLFFNLKMCLLYVYLVD